MPNVDKCARLCERAMLGEDVAEEIARITDQNRTISLRGKSVAEIRQLLDSSRSTVEEYLAKKYANGIVIDGSLLPTGNSNPFGADFFYHAPNRIVVDVETKFGNLTDKAAGMGPISKLCKSQAFKDALAVAQREKWRAQFLCNCSDSGVVD